MALDITKITSKGQVVIPQEIRDAINIKEGERFVIYSIGDTIYMKRLAKIDKAKNLEEFRKAFEPLWEIAKSRNISEKDIEDEIKAVREEKRNAKTHA